MRFMQFGTVSCAASRRGASAGRGGFEVSLHSNAVCSATYNGVAYDTLHGDGARCRHTSKTHTHQERQRRWLWGVGGVGGGG